jgi:hypothetical protein
MVWVGYLAVTATPAKNALTLIATAGELKNAVPLAEDQATLMTADRTVHRQAIHQAVTRRQVQAVRRQHQTRKKLRQNNFSTKQ